jgi:hypothetical protein
MVAGGATLRQNLLKGFARRCGPLLFGRRCQVAPQIARDLCETAGARPSLEQVQGLFAEARLLLQDALDSKGTVYFSEDFADARAGVDETLSAYENLLKCATSEQEREAIKNANDPKMRQLREEFVTIEEDLINDED